MAVEWIGHVDVNWLVQLPLSKKKGLEQMNSTTQ
jgi:hypothetical protein